MKKSDQNGLTLERETKGLTRPVQETQRGSEAAQYNQDLQFVR